jgi:UDP-glucuronate 4-epimerase
MPRGQGDVCSPIHEEDIYAQTSGLLEAASVPATISNWGGDEGVPVSDLANYIAKRIGREVKIEAGPDGIHQYWLDPSKRIGLAGACEVTWQAGVDRMISARHPDLQLA